MSDLLNWLAALLNWLAAEPDNLATLIGSAIPALALLFASRQWRLEQRRKSRETMNIGTSSFDATPGARNAILLLEGREIDVPLWDHSLPEKRYVRVRPDDVAAALLPETFRPWQYYPMHHAIRRSFSDYLGKIARIELDIRQMLITEADADYFGAQFARTLKDLAHRQPAIVDSLCLYVESMKFTPVQDFALKYGCDLKKRLTSAQQNAYIALNAGRYLASQTPEQAPPAQDGTKGEG